DARLPAETAAGDRRELRGGAHADHPPAKLGHPDGRGGYRARGLPARTERARFRQRRRERLALVGEGQPVADRDERHVDAPVAMEFPVERADGAGIRILPAFVDYAPAPQRIVDRDHTAATHEPDAALEVP